MCYWRAYPAYWEAMRRALHPAWKSEFRNSPFRLLICLSECLFHLISFLPALQCPGNFCFFGTQVSLTLDKICYLAIIVRNYHSIRLFYWLSAVPTLRTLLFSELAGINSTQSFVFRGYLAKYRVVFVCAISASLVLILGLIGDLFEPKEGESGLWLAACAYLSLGYGEKYPFTSLGRAVIVVSALFGCFSLGLIISFLQNATKFSLQESRFLSEMTYRRAKQQLLTESIVLIQRWWRFLALHKQIKAKTLSKYTNLAKFQEYKAILASCESAKSGFFPQQLLHSHNSLHCHFHSLHKSLFPVLSANFLAKQVSSQASAIHHLCQSLTQTGPGLRLCPQGLKLGI